MIPNPLTSAKLKFNSKYSVKSPILLFVLHKQLGIGRYWTNLCEKYFHVSHHTDRSKSIKISMRKLYEVAREKRSRQAA